jgi:probable HAF family extracellular repeat protein
MNTTLIIGAKKCAIAVLLCGVMPWVQAASYRITEITKDNVISTGKKSVKDLGFEIFAGNQYLNNNAQVVGASREYYQDKVFNYGSRVFIWHADSGRHRTEHQGVLRILEPLATDNTGYGESIPSGLNSQGQVVGTSRYYDKNGIDQGLRAVYWANGAIVDLGKEAEKMGFVSSSAAAINASGQVAGTGLLYEKGQDKGTRPLLWSGWKAKNLGSVTVDSSGYADNVVTGINAAGHVLGIGYYPDNHSFLWADNKLKLLSNLGVNPDGFYANSANAINDKDQLVGNSEVYAANGDYKGVFSTLWQNGLVQNLGALNPDPVAQPYDGAVAINQQGQVIGYSNLPNGQHAYFWANGQMQDIGALGLGFVDDKGIGYEYSYPNAVNNTGQVVGYSSYSEGKIPKGNHAFIYYNKILTDLNTLLPPASGWVFENALAINDKGQVTVYGTYTKGTETYKGYGLLTPAK